MYFFGSQDQLQQIASSTSKATKFLLLCDKHPIQTAACYSGCVNIIVAFVLTLTG